MNILELSEQEIGRRQSLQQLRDMGINPYPAAEYPVTNWSEDIKANFHDDEKLDVTIAGRMMSRRVMGKASFIEPAGQQGTHPGVHHPRRHLPRGKQRFVQRRVQETARHR